METQGCVFDLDGVLIASEPVHMNSWRRSLAARGHDLDEAEWMQIGIGMTDVEFWRTMARRFGLDPDDLSALEDKRRMYKEAVAEQGIPTCPGVEALIGALGARMPLAVATSSERRDLDSILRAKGWDTVFRFTVTRDEVRSPKPSPEIYLKAAAGIGVEPHRCLAIEDSPAGLRSALDAGMKTIATTTSFPAERLAGAGLIVDSLEEIERIFVYAGIQ